MGENQASKALFDLDEVFEVEDYLCVYSDDLTDERSGEEVASWVRWLELDSPMQILDLACGLGRHANRLAALGHSVTGVDYTPGFLEIARRDAERMGVQVDYQHGDMRRLPFVEEFDRVMLLFTSFGYFEDDENAQVVEEMARALKPGGLLGLDVPNRDVVVKDLPASFVQEKDGGLIINRLSFDLLTGRFHNRRIVIRDGIRRDKPHSVRLYNLQEMRDMLTKAGLEVARLLGYNGQPLSERSRGMVIVARKPL